MTAEEWRAVVGYEGVYEVSDHGRVRSLNRLDSRGRRRRGQMLRPATHKEGYRHVSLRRDGVAKTRKVHLLVLAAFVGPRPIGLVGCHRDGDPGNNEVRNLRWDTQRSNVLDSVKHGTHHMSRRDACGNGHRLAPFNVQPKKFRDGYRVCWACNLAQTWARDHREAFDQSLADHYYSLLESGWVPVRGQKVPQLLAA
ncbi:NUMOD4 motif-containing HNH endonuclease [Microbacterium allomyrinae]|uniref:NUMOD4 motif-containing HNH endonuclease n=1 Tax=Microbacterium allomyrinae TaxID=2830666 RepID=A0A9X1S1B1_9MICO|nr:NUMOD4 motif-containing HNH endonuclease [Microbacterium allomyrinae]MCC2030629.1 NUMOD4 motif-containing HNH endonuclease [Microbacterium allomyrinae]